MLILRPYRRIRELEKANERLNEDYNELDEFCVQVVKSRDYNYKAYKDQAQRAMSAEKVVLAAHRVASNMATMGNPIGQVLLDTLTNARRK